jgi:hypothetical protein
MRVLERDDHVVVAIANAYDTGFATCFANGSRALLDAFAAAHEPCLHARRSSRRGAS